VNPGPRQQPSLRHRLSLIRRVSPRISRPPPWSLQEDTGRRVWKQRWGPVFQEGGPWRPVEPFERTGASDSKAELPTGIPPSALRNPKQYYDHVGNDMLAGGTPLRFGGQWDIVSQKVTPWQDPNKKPNVVKKGPHDCYCDIGCAPWDISPPPRLDVHSHRVPTHMPRVTDGNRVSSRAAVRHAGIIAGAWRARLAPRITA
jgi:hypothetical protein